jgi:hypothetical protein
MHLRDGKFEVCAVYAYTIEGGAMTPTLYASSFKADPQDKTKTYIDHKVVGDFLYSAGRQISGEGQEIFKWDDVFVRVGR